MQDTFDPVVCIAASGLTKDSAECLQLCTAGVLGKLLYPEHTVYEKPRMDRC